MNAIAGYLSTTSVVEAGSQLHVLGTFGTNQKDLLDQYLALEQRVDQQLAQIRQVSTRAADTVRNATQHLALLRKTINDSRTRIAVALAGIHEFQTAATSATSPILGPSRLTAKQMADYVVAQHYTTNITVPIQVLAQIYLDEGARTGVRGDVAFAQSILETGGFANPGSAATDNNFAGIGWCDSCAHGFDFPDAKTGVRAQLQLLRIYVDPTFPDAKYTDKILLPGTLTLGFRGQRADVVGLVGDVGDRRAVRATCVRHLRAHGGVLGFRPDAGSDEARSDETRSDETRSDDAEALGARQLHRQMPYAGVLVAPRPFDRTGDLDVAHAVAELVEHDANLEARQVGTETVVHAVAESEVRVRIAGEVEAEGLGEHTLVAVRGGLPEHDLVAGVHRLAEKVEVAGGGAAVVGGRVRPAHDLLDTGTARARRRRAVLATGRGTCRARRPRPRSRYASCRRPRPRAA